MLLTVRIRPDADGRKIVEKMRRVDCFVDEDVVPLPIALHPDVENMEQLFRLLKRVVGFDGVESIYHDVLLHQRYYSTWRDKLLKERAVPAIPRASK